MQGIELRNALSQIAEIHGHLDRSEVFRGLHPRTVALSGVLAVALAAVQTARPVSESHVFVLSWLGLAALAATLGGVEIARGYWRDDPVARRRTRRMVGQLAPSLTAGAVITAALLQSGEGELLALLPGLWALLFGTGVLATRPFLPRHIGWIGLFYLVSGAGMLLVAPHTLAPWSMGTTFGLGQLAAALVLALDRERRIGDVA